MVGRLRNMESKQATPSTGAATKFTTNNITYHRLGDYEKRCLECLILGSCERSKLDKVIGTTNSPEFVRQLRLKGLKIHTSKVKGLNRDGKKVWWGEYYLDAGSFAKAKAMLGGE